MQGQLQQAHVDPVNTDPKHVSDSLDSYSLQVAGLFHCPRDVPMVQQHSLLLLGCVYGIKCTLCFAVG